MGSETAPGTAAVPGVVMPNAPARVLGACVPVPFRLRQPVPHCRVVRAVFARLAGTLLLTDGIVYPALNAECVEPIVVVVAATILSAIAHVGDEQGVARAGSSGAHEDATAGVTGADVAGNGPERPRFIDDSSQRGRPDAPFSIPRGNGTR